MTENVTNEPILAHLKLTQAKLSDHDERFSRVESELRAIKVHVARLVQSVLTRVTAQASLSIRLDRIERGLDLTD
ncbi:MAG: hypothetical protein OXI95_05660 [bacterium]|nr:hypothetical protein [bacterium]